MDEEAVTHRREREREKKKVRYNSYVERAEDDAVVQELKDTIE